MRARDCGSYKEPSEEQAVAGTSTILVTLQATVSKSVNIVPRRGVETYLRSSRAQLSGSLVLKVGCRCEGRPNQRRYVLPIQVGGETRGAPATNSAEFEDPRRTSKSILKESCVSIALANPRRRRRHRQHYHHRSERRGQQHQHDLMKLRSHLRLPVARTSGNLLDQVQENVPVSFRVNLEFVVRLVLPSRDGKRGWWSGNENFTKCSKHITSK